MVEGQIRALERAYAKAGVSPATVGYVEAHGTGTALGDVVEIEALGQLFRDAGASSASMRRRLGQVADRPHQVRRRAGRADQRLAGALSQGPAADDRHRDAQPQARPARRPVPALHAGQPWLHPPPDRPRRAGVSAFGFGGTNFHAVLEEYDRNVAPQPESTLRDWPAELLVWEADQPAQLDRADRSTGRGARCRSAAALCDLSHTLIAARGADGPRRPSLTGATLAIVAARTTTCARSCGWRGRRSRRAEPSLDDPRGIFFAAEPAWAGAAVAFLFPGQGPSRPACCGSWRSLSPRSAGRSRSSTAPWRRGGPRSGPLVFPPPAFDDEAERRGAPGA